MRSERHRSKRGAAMVSAMVVFLGLFGLLYATVAVSGRALVDSRRSVDDVRARYLAEAGFERGMQFLRNAVSLNDAYNPMLGLGNLFLSGPTITPFVAEPLMAGGGQVGAYTVSMTAVDQTMDSITIRIDATGYLPDAPAVLPAGRAIQAWEATSVTVRYELAPSEVFDYAYFINNWGWFYGSTIIANGNVRSNGQFDAAGYSPWINCQPTYSSVDNDGVAVHLEGYRDDNEDGLADGNDGGVWSGWDIVAAHNLRGTGSNSENQHDFQGKIDMPNLSDLSRYEARATSAGTTVSVGGSVVSDAVYGDEPGETGNLYLHGTAADPIVIDGPLVVRGDVIISGYVAGQGAIYAGGNVYCPDSVRYVDPPTTSRPTGNTQAETEQWLTDNWDKDFLGLFARENIVVGDYTNGTWRSYVNSWMNSSLNKSKEDAGEDGIPNTSEGRDGITGTADDDVLEDDGVFTVEYYTEVDEALGLIPPGKSVGDVIPGTGEDIDGDGAYDDTTTLADLDVAAALNTTNWGGNMPPGGIANYRDIATLYANHLDATFYTNHSFCYMVLGGTSARINGALVSRNENIIYGTPTIDINYDCRLLGGRTGMAGDLLPQVMQSPVIVRWQALDRDPNRYLEPQP